MSIRTRLLHCSLPQTAHDSGAHVVSHRFIYAYWAFNELGYLIASMSELWYGCSATGQVGGGAVGGESKHDWHE